jgi:uncharacterized phage protein gp47/JayE
MQLSLQNFTSLVQNMAASVQSAATQLLDLTVGSTLRAVLEANASIALWMQWLILQVLQTTRAATSMGADLDSWMADMSLTRLPAVAAGGLATFSRFTATAVTLVPVGALVRTADGTQTFAVIASPAIAAFNTAQNGYVLAAGVASLDLPVQALTPGSAGNVQAGSVSLLASAIPGIDAVTNANAFQNGLDAEQDSAFRARFQNFIDSRSRATPLAIGYAIGNIQQGLEYTIQENVDTAGNPRLGSFVVTVDDGSGSPSGSLLATVTAAVDAVRPIGSIFAVQPPSVIQANVALTIAVSPATARAQAASAVGAAIAIYIDALPIGASLPISRIVQLVYGAHPAVSNVSQVQINSATTDITPLASGVVKAGTIAVN